MSKPTEQKTLITALGAGFALSLSLALGLSALKKFSCSPISLRLCIIHKSRIPSVWIGILVPPGSDRSVYALWCYLRRRFPAFL
jgi:hypothetical protein